MARNDDQLDCSIDIVTPENIDAIRALAGTVKGGRESIRITDEALGVRRDFLAA